MTKTYLMLVLHTHMPYLLDISTDLSLEERLLFEVISESYLRLIQVFDHLSKENICFPITISLSPVLMAQLENPAIKDKLERYLSQQIRLSKKEIFRTRKHLGESLLSNMYKEMYEGLLETFVHRCNCNIIEAFRSFEDYGVEIITCPATHPYLPHLRPVPSSIRAQIRVAVNEYKRIFNKKPHALWLPECGYFPGLDQLLARYGLISIFLDSEVFQNAKPKPQYGTYAPIRLPSNLIAFGRDAQSAKQVWSSVNGYPGDADYRDYYKDIGFDLEYNYIKPFLPNEKRSFTGLKYHSIGIKNGDKDYYNPALAKQKVQIHVDDFLTHRLDLVRKLAGISGLYPIICAFYDTELFGHWWFEGPFWIEALFRKMVECIEYLQPTTPKAFLSKHQVTQCSQPPDGSWGWKGYHEVWLDSSNKWMYPHLFKAGEKMELLAKASSPNILHERALNQAGRELMLAQSSDWSFILHNKTLTDYATRRFKTHIGRFWRLVEGIEADTIDNAWLAKIEGQDNIFPSLSYRDFL